MHEEAIRKADVLIEALGFIRKFHGKFTVIKLGGSVMEDPETLRALLVDVVFMQTVGMRPVVVHGGGKAITVAMEKAGLEARFVQGRRYTDEPTLAIVARVLAEEINADIERHINKFGGRASGLHHKTHQCLYGRKLWLANGPAGPHRPGAGGRGDARSTCRRSRTSAWRASCPCFPRWPRTRTPKASSQRQRRYRRRRRRPGASGREAGLSHRHARHPARPDEPSSLIRGLTPDGCRDLIARGRHRQGDDPQGRGLPDQPRSRGSRRPTSSTAGCATRCCWRSSPRRGIGTEIVRQDNGRRPVRARSAAVRAGETFDSIPRRASIIVTCLASNSNSTEIGVIP